MDRRVSPVQLRPGQIHSNADGLSKITDTLPSCPEYLPTIQLDQLPCRGCKFCTRARQQWGYLRKRLMMYNQSLSEEG
jgi:hypothetical protein